MTNGNFNTEVIANRMYKEMFIFQNFGDVEEPAEGISPFGLPLRQPIGHWASRKIESMKKRPFFAINNRNGNSTITAPPQKNKQGGEK